MFVFYGDTANGKTALMNMMIVVLQNNLYIRSARILCDRRMTNGVIRDLKNKRMCLMNDASAKDIIKEDIVGKFTTDVEEECAKHNIVPYFKMVSETNHYPVTTITNHDPKIKNRVEIVPFKAHFVQNPISPDERKINKDKIEELRGHLNEFFVWLVKGSIEYYKNGLPPLPGN